MAGQAGRRADAADRQHAAAEMRAGVAVVHRQAVRERGITAILDQDARGQHDRVAEVTAACALQYEGMAGPAADRYRAIEVLASRAGIHGQITRAVERAGKGDFRVAGRDRDVLGRERDRTDQVDGPAVDVANITVDGDAARRGEVHRSGDRDPFLRDAQGLRADRQRGQVGRDMLEAGHRAGTAGQRVQRQALRALDGVAEADGAAVGGDRQQAIDEVHAAIEGNAVITVDRQIAGGDDAAKGRAGIPVTEGHVRLERHRAFAGDARGGAQRVLEEGLAVALEYDCGAGAGADRGLVADLVEEMLLAFARRQCQVARAVDGALKDDRRIYGGDRAVGGQQHRAVEGDVAFGRAGQGSAELYRTVVIGQGKRLRPGDAETARQDQGERRDRQTCQVALQIRQADDARGAGVQRQRIGSADRGA